MNDQHPMDLDRILDELRGNTLSEAELANLERQLLEDEDLRRSFRARMRLESHLFTAHRTARPDILPPVMGPTPPSHNTRWWLSAAITGMAASLAVALLVTVGNPGQSSPTVVARIESSNEAAWVSAQPTTVGSGLTAGEVELKNGLAELRFDSGALVALEAPARLVIIDPMRCRLIQGTVVVEAPESAKGFVVETPSGYAVDHGTRFAVQVDDSGNVSDFGVHAGRISVHHDGAQEAKTLNKGEAARLTNQGIEPLTALPSTRAGARPDSRHLRLRTHGRETSVIRNNLRNEWLAPDLLMVKMDRPVVEDVSRFPTELIPKDRRALFGFSLGNVPPGLVQSAKLQLNLVPSGLGHASYLPERSTFEVYGIADRAALESWQATGLAWEDAPGSTGSALRIDPGEASLLGTFDVPRGREDGPVIFASKRLVEFLQSDTTGQVDFLLVMSTPPLKDWSRVHAFAATNHPVAAGPSLEIILRENTDH